MRNLVNSAATRLVGNANFINMNIPKWCLKERSELDYFSKDLPPNLTAYSEQSSGFGIDIGGGARLTTLHTFLLLGFGI